MKKIILPLLLISTGVFASLESKLDALNIPDDKVTPLVSEDKLYIVNTRYSSLRNRHEVTLGGARDFMADSHLESRQVSGTYRYHINSKFSLGLRHSIFENDLTESGDELFGNESILPDSDYAIKSTEFFGTYNLFYGKLRVSSKKVVYFDNYVTLGYGKVELASMETSTYSADIGVAFWLGKSMSARLGVKNDFYMQQKIKGNEAAHNMMGYVEFGYLFGEGSRL
jgi:outer membrane beta-barrel protein